MTPVYSCAIFPEVSIHFNASVPFVQASSDFVDNFFLKFSACLCSDWYFFYNLKDISTIYFEKCQLINGGEWLELFTHDKYVIIKVD